MYALSRSIQSSTFSGSSRMAFITSTKHASVGLSCSTKFDHKSAWSNSETALSECRWAAHFLIAIRKDFILGWLVYWRSKRRFSLIIFTRVASASSGLSCKCMTVFHRDTGASFHSSCQARLCWPFFARPMIIAARLDKYGRARDWSCLERLFMRTGVNFLEELQSSSLINLSRILTASSPARWFPLIPCCAGHLITDWEINHMDRSFCQPERCCKVRRRWPEASQHPLISGNEQLRPCQHKLSDIRQKFEHILVVFVMRRRDASCAYRLKSCERLVEWQRLLVSWWSHCKLLKEILIEEMDTQVLLCLKPQRVWRGRKSEEKSMYTSTDALENTSAHGQKNKTGWFLKVAQLEPKPSLVSRKNGDTMIFSTVFFVRGNNTQMTHNYIKFCSKREPSWDQRFRMTICNTINQWSSSGDSQRWRRSHKKWWRLNKLNFEVGSFGSMFCKVNHRTRPCFESPHKVAAWCSTPEMVNQQQPANTSLNTKTKAALDRARHKWTRVNSLINQL